MPHPAPLPPTVSGGLPVIGHAIEFLRDRPGLLLRGYEEHGNVFALKLGPRRSAVMIGPEYHELFFGETDKKLSIEKPYRFLEAMFGQIGFVAPPDVYKEQRPVLMAPFKGNRMPRYIEVMQYEIRKWLDGLGDEGEMELTSEMNGLVQEVAGHALMGRDFQESVGREFWDLYEDLSASIDVLLPPRLPLPKFRRRDRAKRK
ncbi:MAG: cytochrome P450, partial [Verrucomicrobiales bacterium]